jgi:hypothetical protein
MKEHNINMDGLSVCIGMPSTRDIHPLTVKSLFATQMLCLQYKIPCQLAMVAGNAVVQWARDEVIDLFLQSTSNRLFCIDSDIVWDAKDFVRLLALSQVKDVLCASYTAKKDQPTFYIRHDPEKLTMDEYGLIEVMGAGLGFTVIRREVVERIYGKSPRLFDEISGREMASIFHVGSIEGKRRGEDMSFFEAIIGEGYKINLDPSINLGHIGMKVYTGKVMDALRLE